MQAAWSLTPHEPLTTVDYDKFGWHIADVGARNSVFCEGVDFAAGCKRPNAAPTDY